MIYKNHSLLKALWASNTKESQATYAKMQEDGNFVVYTENKTPRWATGTDHNDGAFLTLQDDGSLVLYSTESKPLWASETKTSCS